MDGTAFEYHAPLQSDSPWPTYRRTIRNSGSSPLTAQYQDDRPWFSPTGKGIFSTPIIDGDGVVYIGAANDRRAMWASHQRVSQILAPARRSG